MAVVEIFGVLVPRVAIGRCPCICYPIICIVGIAVDDAGCGDLLDVAADEVVVIVDAEELAKEEGMTLTNLSVFRERAIKHLLAQELATLSA